MAVVSLIAMKPFLFFIALAVATPVFAQSNDEAAVRASVNQLFEGMKKADSTLLKPIFAPAARLQTVINKQGDVSVDDGPIGTFMSRVGKAKPGALDERLLSMDIKIDGELATVKLS